MYILKFQIYAWQRIKHLQVLKSLPTFLQVFLHLFKIFENTRYLHTSLTYEQDINIASDSSAVLQVGLISSQQ